MVIKYVFLTHLVNSLMTDGPYLYLVEIEIPVVNSLFKQGKILTEELIKIKEVIGDQVIFTKTTERFFVDQTLKQQVMDQLLADFKQNILVYLNHPDFAYKFVLKTYSEKKQKPPQ